MGKAPAAPFARLLDEAREDTATHGAWIAKLHHRSNHYGACIAVLHAAYERNWDALDVFMVGINGDVNTPIIPFAEGTKLRRLPVEARKSIMLALHRRAMVELAEHIFTMHGCTQPAPDSWEHICGVLGVPCWGDAQNLAQTLDEIARVRQSSGYGSCKGGWLVDVMRRCQQPDFMGGYLQEWHVQRTIDKAVAKKAA
ncbi:MAG: hypothetical protein IKZ87_01290 [Actinomycetaceae bacterium]|nr:hypothetical protein [Actinomycetaceae bacterium]